MILPKIPALVNEILMNTLPQILTSKETQQFTRKPKVQTVKTVVFSTNDAGKTE